MHIVRNLGILIPVNVNVNHVLPNTGTTQAYDVLAKNLSSIALINLAIWIKLDDNNYLIWCKKNG